jgi:hypothetical protein
MTTALAAYARLNSVLGARMTAASSADFAADAKLPADLKALRSKVASPSCVLGGGGRGGGSQAACAASDGSGGAAQERSAARRKRQVERRTDAASV